MCNYERFPSTQNAETMQKKSVQCTAATEMPLSAYINVTIEDRDIKMLVDTGSTHSFVTSRHAKKHGLIDSHNFTPQKALNASTASGDHIQCLGHVATKVKIGTNTFNSRMIVADLLEEGIMGMDVISALGCNIDFTAMNMRIGTEYLTLLDKNGGKLSSHNFPNSSRILPTGRCLDMLPDHCQGQQLIASKTVSSACLPRDVTTVSHVQLADIAVKPGGVLYNDRHYRFCKPHSLKSKEKRINRRRKNNKAQNKTRPSISLKTWYVYKQTLSLRESNHKKNCLLLLMILVVLTKLCYMPQ
jgi:predicted aspartyl protease